MKLCPRCKRSQPESAFAKNKHAGDGLQMHCRECNAEQHRLEEGSRRVQIGRACGLEGRPNALSWRAVLQALRDKFSVPV
jgi:hypothetical protein